MDVDLDRLVTSGGERQVEVMGSELGEILHRRTRDDEFLHFLGGHLIVFTLPNYRNLGARMVTYQPVDRLVAMYPAWQTAQARAVLLDAGPRDAGRRRVDHGRGRRVRAGRAARDVMKRLVPRSRLDAELTAPALRVLPRVPWLRDRVPESDGRPTRVLSDVDLPDYARSRAPSR